MFMLNPLPVLALLRRLHSTLAADAHFAFNLSSSVSGIYKFHARLIRSNLLSVDFLGDRLVSGYAKYGLSGHALRLFDEILVKDLASWNSVISSLFRCGACDEGLVVFRRLLSESDCLRPSEVTVLCVLPYCARDWRWLNVGRCLHGFVEKAGLSFDVKVLNSLVSMYGKCGDVEVARGLFEGMTMKSLVTWNSILAVYAANGCKEEAFALFRDMRKCGFGADRATLLSLVHVCTMWGVARQGKAVHAYTLSAGFGSDVPIATAVMHFYAKTGDLCSSYFVFYEIDRPDVLAWTTMIAACAVHGQGREAIDVFWGMISDGVSPDHVTFTHVLSACSHTGLVEEGRKYFNIMIEDYGIEPTVEHYSCVVDLLGRAGLLIEARGLIESMPFEPNSAVWGAMLASCRLYHDIQLGKEAAEKLFALNPLDANNYIVLFNLFLREGMGYEASKIRCLMKERGLRKDSGCSFVEHKNHIVRFVVGDRSHPLSNEIYAKLDALMHKMCSAGYVPITEYVLHDVDEELKEHMLGVHSEKLAIAFGLIVIPDVAPIVIMKNLRICGDCHLAAKFISSIEKRTLIIRDSKRFHHFAHGKCSCEDYW